MKDFRNYLWSAAPSCMVAAVALLWFLIASPQPWLDRDLGWHIAAGQWILDHHSIPQYTLWSFTAENTPWYNLSWLWDILIAFTLRAGGDGALLYLTACVMAATFGLLAHCMLRLGIAPVKIIPVLIIAALAITPFSVPRPQIISYLLTMLFLLVLERTQHSRRPFQLALLPLLMLLWVNMHGAFITGFVMIGVYGLEALLEKNHTRFKGLFFIGAACLLSLFITPLGFDVVAAVMRTLHTSIAASVTEWKSFVFLQYPGASIYLLMFILLGDFSSRERPARLRLLAFLWLVAALFSFRHFPFFILLSAPLLALEWQRWMPSQVNTAPPARPARFTLPLLLALITLLPPAYTYFTRQERLRVPDTNISDSIDFILAQYPMKRFLNDYNLGGDLVYYAQGKIPLFVDGRAGTAYEEELLEDYLKFNGQEEGWQSLVDKYRLDGIFTYHNWPGMTPSFVFFYEAGAYRDRWKRVFKGQNSSVFLRCGPGTGIICQSAE